MAKRFSDLLQTASVVNNLTTTSAAYVLDARQGTVLNNKIATKATLTVAPNTGYFTAYTGDYFLVYEILYYRSGSTISNIQASDIYEGAAGWTYVCGARMYKGFLNYGGTHEYSNDSQWIKFIPGTNQQAIKYQIYYYAGNAYRYINASNNNGIGTLISNAAEFSNTSLWEPVTFTQPSFTTSDIKSAVTSGSWINGELQGTQPAGSTPNMKFCDAQYRYEYMNGMSDTTGTSYVWVRTIKSISS